MSNGTANARDFDECREYATLFIGSMMSCGADKLLLQRGREKFRERGRGFFLFEFDSKNSCLTLAHTYVQKPKALVLPMVYQWDPLQCGDPDLPRTVASYDPETEVCILVRLKLDHPLPDADYAQFQTSLKPQTKS